MTPRTLAVLKLLATIGLGTAYLAVAVLAAHPHVDTEYRSHYLDHIATCWLPKALRTSDSATPTSSASLSIAQLGYPAACRILRLGWFDIGDEGVWAHAWPHAPDAILHLPRQPGTWAIELTLRAAPPPNPAIRAHFTLNGNTVAAEIQPGTIRTIILPLPPEDVPYDPDMRLAFQDYATIPDPQGGTYPMRDVGLELVTIRYLPIQPGTAQGEITTRK